MAVDPKYQAVETNSGLYIVRSVVTFALASIASQFGRGVTITRTTNGTYDALFNERPFALMGVHLSVTGGVVFAPQVTLDTLATNSKLQIKVLSTTNTATDIGAGEKLFCEFVMRTLS